MRGKSRAPAIGAVIAVMALAGAAAAGDWEIELHGGGLLSVLPSSGRVRFPPGAESFQTVVPGVSAAHVTSWYFGDGGGLIERRQSNTASSGAASWQYYTIVRPLDRVLMNASVGLPPEGLLGLRLGRRLGRRLTAELNVEYGGYAPTFSSTARSDIEDSRSSFDSAWRKTLSSMPGLGVTSQATVLEGRGRQVVATGVINVNLATGDPPRWSRRPARRRFVSYLTFGAGIVSTRGEEASATLVGRYRFASPSAAPGASFEETDTVTVRSFRTFGTAVVGVVGLGWKQDLSTRSGIRCDARAYLGRYPTRIVVDARPTVATGSPASAVVIQSGVGAIQFVNSSSGIYEGQRSSLSGPALAGFETFSGTGIGARINLTLGAFLRF